MAGESNRKWLQKQIDRDLRVKARLKLADLRRELRAARVQRTEAMKAASERCRTERLGARERARALRIRGLAELREATRLEREAARQACVVSKRDAKSKEPVERRRAELEAERKYQMEMRVIDRGHKQRRREHRHATYIERRAESDDEVRSNVDPSYWSLWLRIKRSIKATPRMSRTEAFFQYVHEHPEEYLEAIEDKTVALVRELEARERDAHRAQSGRGAPRFVPTPEYVSQVPF